MAIDGELAVDQVRAGIGGRVAQGAAATSAPLEALDAGRAHEPGDFHRWYPGFTHSTSEADTLGDQLLAA